MLSMNTQVTATGLAVKVESNNTFLLIGETPDQDTIQSAKSMTIAYDMTPASSAVLPSKPQQSGDVTVYSSGVNVVDSSSAANPTNWFTATNNNPSSATDSINSVNGLVDSAGSAYDFSKYVIKKTIYLTVADGSNPAHDLTVTATSFTAAASKDITAVRVLVVTQNNIQILTSTDVGSAKSLHDNTDQVITDAGTIQVDIYVYYDGSVGSVYTNNINNLDGATINLRFDVSVGTGA